MKAFYNKIIIILTIIGVLTTIIGCATKTKEINNLRKMTVSYNPDFEHDRKPEFWMNPEYDEDGVFEITLDGVVIARATNTDEARTQEILSDPTRRIYSADNLNNVLLKIKELDFLTNEEQANLLNLYQERNPLVFPDGVRIQLEISE